MRKRNLSASPGTRSSLVSSFTASATHCRKPPGPTRLGPTRDCMRAATRRSAQEEMPAVLAVAARARDAAGRLEALGELDLAGDLGQRLALGDLRDALAQDAAALLHLLDAHGEAVPGVAQRAHLAAADRHLELQLGIDRV